MQVKYGLAMQEKMWGFTLPLNQKPQEVEPGD